MVRFDPTYVDKQISDAELDEILDQWDPSDRPDARSLLVKLHLAGWLIGRPYGEPRHEHATQFEDLCFKMGLLIEPFWKIIRHANFSGSFDLIIAIDTLEAIEDFMSYREYNSNTFAEQLNYLYDESYQIMDNVLTIDGASHGAFVGMNHNYTSPEDMFNIDTDTSSWEDAMRHLIEDTVNGFVFEYLRQKGWPPANHFLMKEDPDAILD